MPEHAGHRRRADPVAIRDLPQVLIKLAAADISPVTQIALLSQVALLVRGVFVWRREGSRLFCDGALTSGLWAGNLFAPAFFLGRKA